MNERVEPPREGGTWSTSAPVHWCTSAGTLLLKAQKGSPGSPRRPAATHTGERSNLPKAPRGPRTPETLGLWGEAVRAEWLGQESQQGWV